MPLNQLYRLIRFLLVLVILAFSLICFIYIAKYTYPFIVALIIAFFMNPMVNFFEEKINLTRPVAVFVSILLVLAVITGAITLLVIELINGTSYLADQIPNNFKALVIFFQEFVTQQIIPIYEKLASMLDTLEHSQQTTIMQNVQQIGNDIASNGARFIQNLLEKVPLALGQLPNYITVLVFSLLGTFFISKDWYKLQKMYVKMLPYNISASTREVIYGLKKALLGFIKAQCTLISITATIVLVGLLILRVDHAITIAIITGLVDLLPYLGTGIVFIPWILYMFLTGNYFLTIGLSILYITIVVQRQLMEPKVLSQNIGLNPLATLIALFVGFRFFGLTGLIIGPIILVVINTLYQTGVLNQVWSFIKG